MDDNQIQSSPEGGGSFMKILVAVVLTAVLVFGLTYFYLQSGVVEVAEEEEEEISEEEEAEEVEVALEPDEVEESDVEAFILEYYENLEDGELEDAYAMKYDPDPSFATFEGWYKNISKAEVKAMHDLDNGNKRFSVFLTDNNGDKSEYRTVMRLLDGKLDTVSAYAVATEESVLEANWGSKKAVVKDDGDKQKVYVDGNFIDEFDYEVWERGLKIGTVNKLSFSDDGEYLFMGHSGWEWSGTRIVHLSSGKSLKIDGNRYGFNASKTRFYSCLESGMISGHMNIYNAPSMDLRKSLRPYEMVLARCGGYDPIGDVYTYEIGLGFDNPEKKSYHFGEDQVY